MGKQKRCNKCDHESTGSRSRPGFEKESQHFRVELRKIGFLDPFEPNRAFESLDKNKL
ncbi:23990_t:CDS:2, partial [Entrophospora sp. SA101]